MSANICCVVRRNLATRVVGISSISPGGAFNCWHFVIRESRIHILLGSAYHISYNSAAMSNYKYRSACGARVDSSFSIRLIFRSRETLAKIGTIE